MATTLTPRAPRVFYQSLQQFLRDLPGAAQRFWLLVVATGAAAGLGAVLLVRFLAMVEGLIWPPGVTFLEAVQHASPLRRVLVLAGAGVMVSLASLAMRRPLGGHGTAGIIEAIWKRAGRLPLVRAFLRGIVSIAAVGMGAPLGREGALIQVGAAAGSWMGGRLRVPADQQRLLVACGAASGIAAAYNVPIGGALFGLEVLLGSFALELFGPIVIPCVTATFISRVLLSDHPSYVIPHYQLSGAKEFLVIICLGPLFGAASALYIRGIEAFARIFDRLPRRLAVLWPPLALAAVGVVAIRFPQILGNGYDSVNASLLDRLPLLLLISLPLLKLSSTGLASASGVPGGLFTPSLFYGALIGALFGEVLEVLHLGGAPPGAYALVGMAAILAGTTHASVSAVLIIFELTGDYGLILPIMLCAVISAGVSRLLQPESLYGAALRRRNIALPEPYRPAWLKNVRLAGVMIPGVETISQDAPFQKVLLQVLALPAGRDLYVVTADGRYAGVIVHDHLKQVLPDEAYLDAVIAADVMERLPPLSADLTIPEAAVRFADTHLDKLPVVHPATGELLGAVSKGEVLRHARF